MLFYNDGFPGLWHPPNTNKKYYWMAKAVNGISGLKISIFTPWKVFRNMSYRSLPFLEGEGFQNFLKKTFREQRGLGHFQDTAGRIVQSRK